MKTDAKIMLDQPDKNAVGGGAAYGLFSYVLIPFVLYWVSFSFNDDRFRFWGQLAHYVINFFMAVSLFREYLRDAFFAVRTEAKMVFREITWPVIGIIAYYFGLLQLLSPLDNAFLNDLLMGSLPLGEVDILLFVSDFIYISPILGSLAVILLTPVTTTCLYYAVGFAPVCYKKPWLAYVVVALVLAIPRAINSFLFWSAEQEFAIYLGQLPIHLLACRAYQKSDTVWAPIFCLVIANLVACAMMALFVL